MRALLATLLVLIACTACGTSAQDEKLGAVEAAREAYAEATKDGQELTSGPCLANPLDDPYENWVVDIVHEPRQPEDDEAVNQCSAYRDGKAEHFVELDEFGHLVTAQ